MKEQLCQYCQLTEAYMEDVINSKSQEELLEVLHALVDDVRDLTNLDVIEAKIESLHQAKLDILNSFE